MQVGRWDALLLILSDVAESVSCPLDRASNCEYREEFGSQLGRVDSSD